MIKSRIAVAGALLAVAGAANAGFTVTPTIASDYDFRGVSQTDPTQDGDIAFQPLKEVIEAADQAHQLGRGEAHVQRVEIGLVGGPRLDLVA